MKSLSPPLFARSIISKLNGRQSIYYLQIIIMCTLCYSVNVSYSQNCATFLAEVTSHDISCFGSNNGFAVTSTTGGTQPYFYQWSNNLGNRSYTLNTLQAGTYACKITDVSGCILTKTFSIKEPEKISISFETVASTCGNSTGEATVFASGGQYLKNYYWTNNGETESKIKGVPAGEYTVLVRDSNGCSIYGTVQVEDADGPTIDSKSISPNICFSEIGEGKVEIFVSGGTQPYEYSWSSSELDTTNVISNVRSGFYSVKITDVAGCITVDTTYIGQPDTFNVSVAVTNTVCNSGQGSATASAIGGTPPYNYIWSASTLNSAAIYVLNSGEGSVIVTDANGCSVSSKYEILDINGLSLSGRVDNHAKCFPDVGGRASVTVSGGQSPYSYSWYPFGGNNNYADSLISGEYTIIVVDANGCRQKTNVIIGSPEELKLYFDITAPDSNSSSDGSIKSIG